MKNKLPFLLAMILLGQAVPAQAFTFRDTIGFLFTTTGALKSAANYAMVQLAVLYVQSPHYPVYNSGTHLDKQLQGLGEIHNLDNVIFKPRDDEDHFSPASAIFDRVIEINKKDYEFMLKLVSENKDKNIFLNKDLLSDSDKKNLCRIEAIIHHELGHIKNNDFTTINSINSIKPALQGCFVATSLPDDERMSNRAAVSGAVIGWAVGSRYPVLTTFNAIGSYLLNMVPSHQNTTSELSQFTNQVRMSAFSAAAASLLVDAIGVAVGKDHEVRADDSIPNKPDLLSAAETTMRHDSLPSWLETILAPFDTHPSSSWRADRLHGRRVAALRAAIVIDAKTNGNIIARPSIIKRVSIIEPASLREITSKFKPSIRLLKHAQNA